MTYPMRYAIGRARRILGDLVYVCGMFFLFIVFAPLVDRVSLSVQGYLFPVVSDIQIERATRLERDMVIVVANDTSHQQVVVPKGSQIIHGKFTKFQDCEFQRISWFERDRNGLIYRVRVYSDAMVAGQPDPIGENAFGPWYVLDQNVPAPDTQFSMVEHLCEGKLKTSIMEAGPVPAR